ncbi:MAG: efflux RND transporter permease subunit [Candidatus Obscuribacterales bacterium]
MFRNILARPVLGIVISVLIVFLGCLSIVQLPISQFPNIAPTVVNCFIAYPGASAKVLTDSTLVPLEAAINGVQDMRYMSSDATSAGEATIRVVFEPGTDPNQAVVNVKIRVDQMMSSLPALVQREGVIIRPLQPSMLMYVSLYSDNEGFDEKYLFNYAYTKLIPEIQRITGVANATLLGSRTYSMRLWLKPDRMRAYNISTDDVVNAVKDQSIIARPGQVGISSGKQAQSTVTVLTYVGRYSEPEQYENIIIKSSGFGEMVKLKDIATVELGSEFYDIYTNLDGKPSASIVLKQTTNSNGREVIKKVKEKVAELSKQFPDGIKIEYSYDVSKFLDASIEQVIDTLRDAFILVTLVVFLFLGDWRSTVIPVIAVPISLIGAFLVLAMFGMSINLITLFALVLAIGIVVDDAIVVIEAVHSNMENDPKLTPFAATQKAMGELGGAIIAITMVMISVFVPIAFIPGPVGVFYRQFSITMSSAIIISALVALTLTPVLCAMFLKNHAGHKPSRFNVFQWFIGQFNACFELLTRAYMWVLNRIVTQKILCLLVVGLFAAGIVYLNQKVSSGFVPNEDQGTIYAIVQTPPGSSLEYTNKVMGQLQKLVKPIPGVDSVTSMAGYEIMTEGRGSNAGTCLINLKPWDERKQNVTEIIEELEHKTVGLGGKVEFFEPPAIPGFGTSGGFSLRLLDKTGDLRYPELEVATRNFMKALEKRKEVSGLFTFYNASYPQSEIIIDNQMAMQKGVSISTAMENLDVLMSGSYEQGFVKFGRFFKVFTQAAPEYRRNLDDLKTFFVKNDNGDMVPYTSFMTLKKTKGANEITRYNMYNSAAIRGFQSKGYTTGDAIQAIRDVAKNTLSKDYDIAWEDLSFDQAKRGNEFVVISIIVVLFVYLVLAAQYESFALPLSVLFSLPVGIFGSFAMLGMVGLANDVYAQIAMITLLGLLGKNAVLIVEFAVQKRNQGFKLRNAALEGAKARFRPILMTSFAFVAGLIPLVISHGAGAVGNRTLGSSAMGGMITGTIIGVLVIPGLYYVFATMVDGKNLLKDEDHTSITESLMRRKRHGQQTSKLIKLLIKKTKPVVAADEKPQTTATAKPSALVDANSPVAADEKPTVAADEPTVAADAKPAVAADAKPAVAADSKAPVAADAKPTVAAEPKPTVAGDAKATVAAEPKPPVVADAKATVATNPRATVAAEPKPPVVADVKATGAADPRATVAADAKPTVAAEPKPTVAADAKPTVAADAKPSVAADAKPTVAADAKPSVAADAKPSVAADAKPSVAADAKPLVSADAKPTVAADTKPSVSADAKPPVAADAKPPVAADVKPPVPADAQLQRPKPPVPATSVWPTRLVSADASVQPTRNLQFQPTRNLQFQPTRNLQFQPTRNLQFQPTRNLQFQPTQNLQFQPTRNLQFQPTPSLRLRVSESNARKTNC